MANKRISELNATTSPQTSDVLPIVNEGETKKITYGEIRIGLATTGSNMFTGTNLFTGSVGVSGSLDVDGVATVDGITVIDGVIRPAIAAGSSLGTADFPFGEIFVSSGSIVISSDTPGDPAAVIGNADGNVSIQTAGFQILNQEGTDQVFEIRPTGRAVIRTTEEAFTTGSALSIIGNQDGIEIPRQYNGTLLHLTNQPGQSTRFSMDNWTTGSAGEDRFNSIAFRSSRGSILNPTNLEKDDILYRLTGVGYGDTEIKNGIARLTFHAAEDFTDTQAGTLFRVMATPTGSTTSNIIAEFGGGYVEVSGSVSASTYYGDGSNLTGIIHPDIDTGSFFVSASSNVGSIDFYNGDGSTSNVPLQFPESGSYVQKAYLSCFSTSSISLATSGSEQVIDFTSKWVENGISLVDNNKFTFAEPGVYKLEFLTTIENDTNDELDSWFWIKLNGNNFPNSSTKVTVRKRKTNGEHTHQLVSISILGVAQTAGDYVQLYWTGEDTALGMPYEVATGVHPATPSVTLNIIRVG